MKYNDFIVHYDPAKDTAEDLGRKVLYAIIVRRRLQQNKNAIIFFSGDSGEGKSYSVIALQDVLCKAMGINTDEFFNVMNIHTPLQYPEKMQKLLYDKKYKQCPFAAMHEAREIVSSKMWYSFISRAVADVNAMSRKVKRLCVIVVSQFIRDITNDMRYTLNYYVKAVRLTGQPTRLYFYVLWKDDSDLEKPKLRKRTLFGYLKYPDGHLRRYSPKYIEVKRPRKELTDLFDKEDLESKGKIIKNKLNRMLLEIKKEVGDTSDKIATMLEYYTADPARIHLLGKQWRGQWKIKPEIKKMHDLSDGEVEEFQTKIQERLKELGMINFKSPEIQNEIKEIGNEYDGPPTEETRGDDELG